MVTVDLQFELIPVDLVDGEGLFVYVNFEIGSNKTGRGGERAGDFYS